MHGVMGKVLWVNLTTGEIHDEQPDEKMYQDYLGGYGIGVRYLYDRMPAGVDPLGPDNILGFMTGPLTGTNAITGNRWTVLGKSPKSLTWGDANCGGTFGPALKSAGYDGVFVTGASEKPVYILVEEDKAEIVDASEVWGKGDEVHPEEFLREKHGKMFEVAWIGEAGERLSLNAGVMNDIGRAAARSGLGAVLGSKKLKAIVAGGKKKVPVADLPGLAKWVGDVLKEQKAKNTPIYQMFTQFGTSAATASSAIKGDSPVKNWMGVANRDFPEVFKLSDITELKGYEVKRAGCWHCAIACSSDQKVPDGPYASETHRPEYETQAAFGNMTMTGNLAMTHKANEMTNRYGMDTISTGATIAFAMECYEKGLITKEDTGGLDLTWGNADAVLKMIELMGKREGIGDLLADGVAKAAERIGKGSEEFAVHIHGEEVAMHDPRFAPGLATTYQMDATPARHTQGGTGEMEFVGMPIPKELGGPGKYEYDKKGLAHRVMVNHRHIVNTAGVCIFASFIIPPDAMEQQLTFVTGETWDAQRIQVVGERIATLRHAFNLREGINPVQFKVPERILDGALLGDGPTKDVKVDLDAARNSYFDLVKWDQKTSVPAVESLRALGLDALVEDLHPTPA